MRFASIGGSNAGNYAAAGKAVADSSARMFDKQRQSGPDYAGLSKAAMAAQTAENIAAAQAEAKVAKAGITAMSFAKRSAIKGEFDIEKGKFETKSRMAGVLPAIGKIAGSAFKKDPKRPPPRQTVAPVMPDLPDYPTVDYSDRPGAPTYDTYTPKPQGESDSPKTDAPTSSGGGTQTVAPLSSGQSYSKTELQTLATNAGFPSDLAPTIAAIAMGESSGNPRAHNPDSTSGDNSYGLMQINMLGDMGPSRRQQFGLKSNEELFDPATNFRAAFDIYKSQGLGAWGAYTNGSYKKFL